MNDRLHSADEPVADGVPHPSLSVLLVEDDERFAGRVVAALSAMPAGHRIVRVASLAEARRRLDAAVPDLLVLDLGLPDGHGLELLTHVGDELRVVVLTVATSEAELRRALHCGVHGYLLKDDVAFEQRLFQAMNDAFPVSAVMARFLVERAEQVTESRHPAGEDKTILSKREREILEELARGASYQEVAIALSISHHTVADHIKSIYPKLAVRNRSGAVHRALELGILAPPKV